jgi:hypothetical protein
MITKMLASYFNGWSVHLVCTNSIERMKNMSKRNKQSFSKNTRSNQDWETISTGGFAPMWKPMKDGEDVEIIPLSCKVIPASGKRKESAMVECRLVGGSSEAFFSKDVKRGVANGENISIPLSHQLSGDDKLGTRFKKKAMLSPLASYLLSKTMPMRIVYGGKVKGGQGSVKLFTIQVPRGVREALASKK